MTRSARALFGLALPILTIVIFALLLAFSLMRLSGIERHMRIEATQNMVWVVSRAHISSLRLSEALDRHAGGRLEPAQLELRYNIFLSRLALLDDGPQRRKMEQLGLATVLDDLRDSLPDFQTLAGLGTDETARLASQLEPYNAMLTRAANNAMVAEWDELGHTLDTSREQLWQIIVSLIGISLAGVVLIVHFLAAIRDARRRARLLDKEKAFSELLIASSGEGIIAVDMERRCTVWNEAAERLFSLSAAESIGVVLGDLSGFFEVDRIERALTKSLEGAPAVLFDQPFFPAGQDEPLYLDLRCFSLREGARIIGSILLVSDVTERRAAQREIAEHRDHLEQLVQARTYELDAALEREKATAELYRNFGTMISHQFRTPLAIVDSALQRLMRRREKLSPQEVLERGETARQAISRLTRLVESTLDAARIDAGQIKARSEPCDLGRIVADICARELDRAPEREISLELEQVVPLIARCDSVHAENIFANLLSNAIKYSPPSTPIAVVVAAGSDVIECAVTNVGSLDDPGEREAIFQRYFRGSNAEGRPGIGVGLYMAKTLAGLQGGDVRLLPSPPGTVRVALSLPRALARRGATADCAAQETA